MQAIMELLDDNDFQQLAQNPMAAQIVEQVHGNPEAFRRCATALYCQGSAGFSWSCSNELAAFSKCAELALARLLLGRRF